MLSDDNITFVMWHSVLYRPETIFADVSKNWKSDASKSTLLVKGSSFKLIPLQEVGSFILKIEWIP